MNNKFKIIQPQVPKGGEIFLDHIAWFVPNISHASKAFDRLGFNLTTFVAQNNLNPSGGAPIPAGTGNRCAMLRRGYLEILTTVDGEDTTPLARQLIKSVERYTGVHLIAFTVDDTEAAHQRLSSEGFFPQKPVDLRRPIQLANGVEGEVAFTVLRVPPDCMEEGRIQILRQETPELVWREDLIARENGVSALQGILIAVFDPENAVDRFSRFTGKVANGTNGHFNIDLDRGQISIVSKKKCLELLPQIEIPALPYMAAVILESENLSKTKSFFDKEAINYTQLSDGIIRINQSDAMGATIIIVARGEQWPLLRE